MKTTKLTNISLIPLDISLSRDYDSPEIKTFNKFTILGGQNVEFSGSISYAVDKKRAKDLRVDTYE